MPSSRIRVTASRGEPIASRPATSARSAELGTCAAPETSKGEPSAAVIALLAARSSRPRSTSVRSASGLRHHLQRHLGHDGERAPGARQQLAEVVAGDVLHHLAAGLETVAEARHRVRAEQMIARPARLDPARPGEAGGDHAADGAGSGRAEQRRGIDGLEGELLVLGVDQRHHVGQRRAGLHRDDQLVRLVGGDGVERRQVEHRIGRHRLADLALGAMADDLERLLGGDRRPHRLLDIAGVSYLQDVQTLRPSRASGRPYRGQSASNHPSIGVAAGHKAGAAHAGRELQSHFDRDRTIYDTVRRLSNCQRAAIGAISPPSNTQGSDT